MYRLTIGTGEQVRITEPVPKSEGDFSPHVSRSGRFLAFVRVSTWNNSSIYVQPLTERLLPDGPATRIDTGSLRPSSVAWTFEGDELIFSAGFADHSLWRIALGQGQTPRRLDIVGADDGLGPSASAGDIMAFARVREEAQIWRLDLTKKQEFGSQPLIASLRMNLRPQYSPDGERISFISLRSGYAEIWVSDAGGLKPVALTSRSDPSTGDPFWSPDGSFLAFDAAPDWSVRHLQDISNGRHVRPADSRSRYGHTAKLVARRSVDLFRLQSCRRVPHLQGAARRWRSGSRNQAPRFCHNGVPRRQILVLYGIGHFGDALVETR